MSTLRVVVFLFGIAFIVAGILGFIPAATPGNMLLGTFMVDMIHNLVHILTGVIALIAAKSDYYARLFFRVFGLIYLIVAIIGFVNSGNLFLMQANMADNWLHLGIALFSLFFGFMFTKKTQLYK